MLHDLRYLTLDLSAWTAGCMYFIMLHIRACFLSLTPSKLRLCSANHRAGYFSNLACDWLSIVWAYSEQETENGPRSCRCSLAWPINQWEFHSFLQFSQFAMHESCENSLFCKGMCSLSLPDLQNIITSWHENTFHITGPLKGESIGH